MPHPLCRVDPSGAIKYNFTVLDDVIALLHSLGLKPGFELMGNPSNIFNDFENKWVQVSVP